jgi:hypothetical protein
MTLRVFDLLYLGLAELVPETHEYQQAKHRVLEMANQNDRVNVAGLRRGVRYKAVDKDVQNLLAGARVGHDAGRM